jgi:UDP-N-acetyl-D-glucosamine dehydrogenase
VIQEALAAVSVASDGRRYPIPNKEAVAESLERANEVCALAKDRGRTVVVVQGLGFVGSALAAVLAGARNVEGSPQFMVIGVDLPTAGSYWKIGMINEGRSPIVSPDPELAELIRQGVEVGNLFAVTDPSVMSLADVIVMSVHLDVADRTVEDAEEISVNVDAFKDAVRTVGQHMSEAALVMIETTVPIGTTRMLALPVLEEERAKRGVSQAVKLSHAYERVMPGANYVASIRDYWRTFSGIDERSASATRDFLEGFINTDSFPLYQLTEPESSEMAKLLENSYRAANIAFIHEWTLLAEAVGSNLFAVIESIKVRKGTHDNMRYPGFGVGGYCLTKDSLLAQWSASAHYQADTTLEMTLRALQINYLMPRHTLSRLVELLDGDVSGKRVCVLGLSYMAGVGDTRNTPVELFYDDLIGQGAKVVVHEPYVTEWLERPEVDIEADLEVALQAADAVVFTIPHDQYRAMDADAILEATGGQPSVVDAFNIVDDGTAAALREAKCRIAGVGKGHWRRMGYHEKP